ncbi:MAG: ABC transporter ATP-binding protein/permease [Erysipelotrichaceae bacterium]|nr:ABC transporter ATP-binding protein/permease [Erysipelotrichaceae bacterium]
MKLSGFQVMKRLIVLVKPLMPIMFIAIIMGVLGFVCAISIPVLSMHALLNIQTISLTHILIILVLFALFRGVLHYIEQACNHYIAFKLLAIIRDHVYTALRRLAPAKLDGKDKGNLISLITNDVELLEVFYAHTISPCMIAFIMAIILLSLFYRMNIYAMIIAFVAYFIMAIIIPYIVSIKGENTGQENREEIGNMSSFLLETYRGINTLFQYRLGNKRKEEMLDLSDHIDRLSKKMKNIEGNQMVASQILISLSVCIMFVVMFIQYQNGYTTSYDVIMCTVLMASSFGPFTALSQLSNNLLSTISSGRRVIAILDEEELIHEVDNKETTVFDDIQVNHVDFKYDRELILKDIDISLPKGKTTGIIGKSGSGKSTLLKLLMRFYDPTSGFITINDKDLKTINTSDMRHMFAYVTQETVLFHDSIENNLKIANLDATHEDIVSACQKASIHDFIMSLPEGYQSNVSELGASLSGGERQRLGLARAFLSDKPCILLDEPTSNLDVLNEAMILRSLENETGKTIILVSHRSSTMKIADQIISMDQGRIS